MSTFLSVIAGTVAGAVAGAITGTIGGCLVALILCQRRRSNHVRGQEAEHRREAVLAMIATLGDLEEIHAQFGPTDGCTHLLDSRRPELDRAMDRLRADSGDSRKAQAAVTACEYYLAGPEERPYTHAEAERRVKEALAALTELC